MKLARHQTVSAKRQNGSAVFVFIVLLSLMLLFIAANSGTLFRLHGELRLIERQQMGRWASIQTNSAAGSNVPASPSTP